MRRRSLGFAVLCAATLTACLDGRVGTPGPPGQLPRKDASAADAGSDPADSGMEPPDGAVIDAGFDDLGQPIDAGFIDAGGPEDAGVGPGDAVAVIDSGYPDANAVDGGVRPDSGAPPSSGCGRSHTSGAFNGNIMVDGRNRTFLIYVPPSYNPNNRYQLVFGFHGQSWLGFSYRNAPPQQELEAAAAGRAIFVYPDGLDTGGGTAWNVSPTGYDVRFFEVLSDAVVADYCIDTSRIFVHGTSYGAFFTNTLGCARPSRLRGIAVSSGGGPNFSCSGPVPFWGSHSQDDTTVGYTNGTRSRDTWLRLNQCSTNTVPSTPSPCVSYTGCSAGKPVEWCGLPSGGHTPPPWTGSAMWNFFQSL